MKVIITLGTLFIRSAETERYEEARRFEFDVQQTTTIRELITMVDREAPPTHAGSSYLSLPNSHEALPELATLADLKLTKGAVIRRFSKVR